MTVLYLRVVPQEPQLLLRRPGAVGRVLAVMQSVYKLNSEELLQVIEREFTVRTRQWTNSGSRHVMGCIPRPGRADQA